MSYVIEIQGLDKLRNNFKKSSSMVIKELQGGIRNSVNMIRPMMRQEAPVKTGKLSRNIYAKFSGLSGEVGPNLSITPYAFFVHEGTKSYEIRPKLKKALFWKGALHPVKKVLHPGIKSNPFVERTAEKSESMVNRIFSVIIERIINNLVK